MDKRRILVIVTVAFLAAAAVTAWAFRSPPPASVDRVIVATGLAWPVSFAFVRGAGASGLAAGTIVYAERLTGNVRTISRGQVSAPVANVSVVASGEQGLLGLALDPSFPTAPWVYLYHTYVNGTTGRDTNRVIRVWLGPTAPPGPPPIQVVLDGIPAAGNHNGGILGFAPDGTLFITTGDASVPDNAQDNASLSGKVLRVNPNGSVPPSNPIPGSPVYTLGHRNVFGLAFEPGTGTPYVSENGPDRNDEVNVLRPGRNYGWPFGTGPLGDPRFVDPILTYPSEIAPTGLAFYASAFTDEWQDDLFLGDWNRGDLHRLLLAGLGDPVVAADTVVDSIGPNGILEVEDGGDGYLYYSSGDAIYRVMKSLEIPDERIRFLGAPVVVWLLLGVASLFFTAFLLIVVTQDRRGRPPPEAPPPVPPPR